MIEKYLANLFVFLGTATLFWLLHRIFARRGYYRRMREAGAIRPSRLAISVTLLAGLYMTSGTLYYWQRLEGNAIVFGVLVAAIVMILLALFMTGKENEVSWNREGITGPGFLPFLPGVTKQVRLGWEEITSIGKTAIHMRYVEGGDGKRIYWNRLYLGCGAFEKVLEERRPDLFEGSGA